MLTVKVNGLLVPREARTEVRPRIGFRGATPGSREAGSVSFTIYLHKLPRGSRQPFVKGDKVEIFAGKAGRIYTGVVTAATRDEELPVVQIESKETMAALNDCDAGLQMLGGVNNPELYCYHKESTVQALNRLGNIPGGSYSDEQLSVDVFDARPGSAFESETQAADYGYSKEYVFDSFVYADHGESQRRSMLWTEEIIKFAALYEPFLKKLSDLATVQETGPEITSRAISVPFNDDLTAENVLQVVDDDGNALRGQFVAETDDPLELYVNFNQEAAFTRPRGLVNRTFDTATHYVFYWEVQFDDDGGKIYLYQLINKSRAVKLGWVPLEANIEGNVLSAVHSDVGPFVVPVNSSFPHILAFYVLTGRTNDEGIRRNYRVMEIDLRSQRNQDGSGQIPHRDLSHSETVASEDYKWVTLTTLGGYALTNSPQVLRNNDAEYIMGGRYSFPSFDSPDPVLYRGSYFLPRIAYDFRGKSLRDALHEAAIAYGCDWWMDANGTLRLERLGTISRTIEVESKEVFRDELYEGPTPDPYSGDELSGIPISEFHQRRLTEALIALLPSESGSRRDKEILPVRLLIDLGARLVADSENCGRITAVEVSETGKILYECEPQA